MRKQLNCLYVTTDGAWLRKDGSNIVMEVDRQEKVRIPIHMLESLVCFGRVTVSSPLLGYCAEQGITVCYLSEHGKFLARVEGPVSGNVLLRRAQYRVADHPDQCASIVRNIIIGKIHNQRAVLARGWRDYADHFRDPAAFSHALKRLKRIPQRLLLESDINILRGLEGEAAQSYFSVFDELIRVDESTLRFNGRSRRPPLDAVNALLSFFYTLLTHDCRSALETVGLDPAVGFLHKDRPGRPSLALDLAEEFRAVVPERLTLSLINRRQLGVKDFKKLENGAVFLTDDARRTALIAYQEKKREQIQHAYIDEKVDIGLLPYLQAQLLARHLRGDLDGYPPFFWK